VLNNASSRRSRRTGFHTIDQCRSLIKSGRRQRSRRRSGKAEAGARVASATRAAKVYASLVYGLDTGFGQEAISSRRHRQVRVVWRDSSTRRIIPKSEPVRPRVAKSKPPNSIAKRRLRVAGAYARKWRRFSYPGVRAYRIPYGADIF